MKKRQLAFSVALFLGLQGSLQAATITLPALSDLNHDARLVQEKKEPLIVLFSLPGCPYCKQVRENYLAPLLREPPAGHPVLIREVDVTSKAALKGLRGEVLTQAQFARRYRIVVTPVVLMLDANGVPLADPLVGGDTVGFYGAYFDNALEQSRNRLAAPPASGVAGGNPPAPERQPPP